MPSTKREFPHPLLAANRDDYIDCNFSIAEGNHTTDDKEFVFSFGYELNCPGLEAYLQEGKAYALISVASIAAKFRSSFRFDTSNNDIHINIRKNDLVKSVEFQAFIIANGDDRFSLPEHNKAYYEGASFELRKGDILAESGIVKIELDDSELQKPLTSIFNIVQAPPEQIEPIVPNFYDDKIQISVSQATYLAYDSLRREHSSIRRNLSAVITLPVLVEAIELMCTESEDDTDGSNEYSNYRWFRALDKRFSQFGIDIFDDTLSRTTIANKIYGDIIKDAVVSVKSRLESIEASTDPYDMGAID
jgi:hypothetical protein